MSHYFVMICTPSSAVARISNLVGLNDIIEQLSDWRTSQILSE
jgi:hypothetical protein